MSETMTKSEVESLLIAAFEAERKKENLDIINLKSRVNILERKIVALEENVPVPKVEVENGYRQEIDNLHNRVQILEETK